ncbi:hypothetical protein CJ179_38275 [Rhodococcus sp. ACS1]|nr:hypothetical protein CJ179_38275 [Rhodococcus sp. ACS1]
MTYTTNPNLNGFDKKATKLVKDTLKMGWVAKRGKKSHMVLQAPDGKTMATVQPNLEAARLYDQAAAPIEAWRSKNSVEVKEEDGKFICGLCGHETDNRMSMLGHTTSRHSEPRVCPVCKRKLSTPSAYGQHLKTHRDILNPPPEPEPEPEPEPAVEEQAVESISTEIEVIEADEIAKRRAKYASMSTSKLVEEMLKMSELLGEAASRLSHYEEKNKLIDEVLKM